MHNHLYAVIMAGGVGTRLWPRSRDQAPKQFLDLLGSQTMLQETVQRVAPLLPLSRVLVVVNQDHASLAREQIPGLPAENLLIEPARRNTAPCIGLAATVLSQRDPAAVMATLPADHYIADGAGFRRAIAAAAQVAAGGYLVTLGITPKQPHTGYGYIQRGAPLGEFEGQPVFRVQRFAEKPDQETAQRFMDSGEYYWNAGIFVWRVETILAEISRVSSSFAAALQGVAAAWDTPRQADALIAAWDCVPQTSIDYAVMEKAAQVAVLPVDIGWDDVGSWATLSQLLSEDKQSNLVHGAGRHILLDTAGAYLYTSPGRLVAVVGMEDLIVVDTPTAVLICPKDKTQAVREVVKQLKLDGLEEFL